MYQEVDIQTLLNGMLDVQRDLFLEKNKSQDLICRKSRFAYRTITTDSLAVKKYRTYRCVISFIDKNGVLNDIVTATGYIENDLNSLKTIKTKTMINTAALTQALVYLTKFSDMFVIGEIDKILIDDTPII